MDDVDLKEIYWHGDTLHVIRRFPKSARLNIGSELYLLQIGERPLHSKPMATVGHGVWEIRIADGKGAFRVFYFVKRKDGIHVLHAFKKKTRTTPKADIDIGKARYRELQCKK